MVQNKVEWVTNFPLLQYNFICPEQKFSGVCLWMSGYAKAPNGRNAAVNAFMTPEDKVVVTDCTAQP